VAVRRVQFGDPVHALDVHTLRGRTESACTLLNLRPDVEGAVILSAAAFGDIAGLQRFAGVGRFGDHRPRGGRRCRFERPCWNLTGTDVLLAAQLGKCDVERRG
jgi:hypothetical protein